MNKIVLILFILIFVTTLLKRSIIYTKSYLGRHYRKYSINMFSRIWPVEELIPNYYRKGLISYDLERMPVHDERSIPVVRNISKKYKPNQGL
jgi:hypothetical protein